MSCRGHLCSRLGANRSFSHPSLALAEKLLRQNRALGTALLVPKIAVSNEVSRSSESVVSQSLIPVMRTNGAEKLWRKLMCTLGCEKDLVAINDSPIQWRFVHGLIEIVWDNFPKECQTSDIECKIGGNPMMFRTKIVSQKVLTACYSSGKVLGVSHPLDKKKIVMCLLPCGEHMSENYEEWKETSSINLEYAIAKSVDDPLPQSVAGLEAAGEQATPLKLLPPAQRRTASSDNIKVLEAKHPHFFTTRPRLAVTSIPSVQRRYGNLGGRSTGENGPDEIGLSRAEDSKIE